MKVSGPMHMERYVRWVFVMGILASIMSAGYALTAAPVPARVTLGGMLNPQSDDTPAFTPDGKTVFFDRSTGHDKFIEVSHRSNGKWSAPRIAPFSGKWLDQDPVVSPDGTFLVFSSSRPITPHGDALKYSYRGKFYRGANLWKVGITGETFGTPVWLGSAVNRSNFVVAPSIAGDGSLYFIQHDNGPMHIFRAQYRNGAYRPTRRVVLGDPAAATHDPAVAPDESFIVFDYGQTAGGLGRLCIAFRNGGHWGKPVDLGDAVNRDRPWGARLGPDHRTVYVTGNSNIWRFSLKRVVNQ